MQKPKQVHYLYVNNFSGEATMTEEKMNLPGFVLTKCFVEYEEYHELAKALDKDHGTGLGQSTNSYRYAQIHKAVSDMGGFANFEAWVKEHAADYFASLEKSLAIMADLLKGHKGAEKKAKEMLNKYVEDISNGNESETILQRKTRK